MEKGWIGFLGTLTGRRLSFELADESSVDGYLISVRGHSVELGSGCAYLPAKVECVRCFVSLKRVRFIHLPDQVSVYSTHKRSMGCPGKCIPDGTPLILQCEQGR